MRRGNCIVPLSRKALIALLGGLEVVDIRVEPKDTWQGDFELLVRRPDWPDVPEGMVCPRAEVIFSEPLARARLFSFADAMDAPEGSRTVPAQKAPRAHEVL